MDGAIPMNRSSGALLLFYVLTSAAQAADPRACLAIDDDAKRLACYDTAFDRAPAPAAATAAVPAQAEEFGMNDRLRREKESEEAQASAPQKIQATVTTATRTAQGYFNVTLDNGQKWITTETAPARSFRQGDVVTIRRASFGSFLMARESGGPALRVRRTE